MIPGVTLREVSSALVCAMLATILFCARQGYVAGDYRQAAMLLLFAARFRSRRPSCCFCRPLQS